eukprot:TRINITY_DN985_c0_g1_i1.p1 TRINITY_DN985_c0_g1~~TRINITY_DN985_c0_g1_i1.p1  ORF type:complete len:200 (-),score=73.90 TRINITY_DN985_c0_g1_i1:25-624(-)
MSSKKRDTLSIFAGIIFAIGWFILIDGIVYYKSITPKPSPTPTPTPSPSPTLTPDLSSNIIVNDTEYFDSFIISKENKETFNLKEIKEKEKEKESYISITFPYYLPAIFSTISLICLNIVMLEDNSSPFSSEHTTAVRAWLFASLSLGFGCVAAGIVIFVVSFPASWTGATFMLQPIIVVASGILLLFARKASYEFATY